MSLRPIPPDNSLPLVVGYQYRLKGAGDNWVEIVYLTPVYVTAHGVWPTIMDQTLRRERFDDICTGEYVAPSV